MEERPDSRGIGYMCIGYRDQWNVNTARIKIEMPTKKLIIPNGLSFASNAGLFSRLDWSTLKWIIVTIMSNNTKKDSLALSVGISERVFQ